MVKHLDKHLDLKPMKANADEYISSGIVTPPPSLPPTHTPQATAARKPVETKTMGITLNA